MKKAALSFYGMFLSSACMPISKTENTNDAQAVKRFERDGDFYIVAQKPDDMKIVAVSSALVPFKTAGGVRGTVSLVRNGDYNFITVREALADGLGARLADKSIRDVFLIPKINGRPDNTIQTAKSEGWKIEKIVSSLESYAQLKEVRIYCPLSIEFRKNDGTRHVSKFPFRPNCDSDIEMFIGDIQYK